MDTKIIITKPDGSKLVRFHEKTPIQLLSEVGHDTDIDKVFTYICIKCYMRIGPAWVQQWVLSID